MAPGNLSPRIALRTRPSAIAIAVAGAMAAAAPSSFALPTGGKVAAGEAAIFESSPTSLQITQSTHKAILNWQGFSIAGNESVNFSQPSASSVALNRVLGNNPSEIFGRLTANGQIFLSNPNGVLFGRGASVDVGGLVATTLSITDSDFLSGNYVFSNAGAAGSVINEGSIVTANGYTALIGPQVSNSGIIAARLGSVALAAADRVSLDMVGDGLISVSLDQAAVNAAAVNGGTITADGGHVLLTARSANALLDTVVNNSGVIRANSLVERNGEIVLDGGGAGSVVHSGDLQAAGVDSGTTGGSVRVLGDNVRLASGSRIDASGDAGGGTVLVGGDFQGKNPSIRNASFTTVEEGASIDVSAITSGNGGRAIVWADKTTTFDGHISARGGALSGNGGFVEVSGKQNLDLGGLVGHFDLSAPNGEGGNLLLDPNRIEIVATAQPDPGLPAYTESGNTTTQIEAADLAALLAAGTDVTLATTDTSSQDDDIDVQTAVAWSGTGHLQLNAGDEVLGTGNVTPSGGGSFGFTDGDVDLIFTVDVGQTKVYNGAGADPAITAIQSGAMANGGDVLSGSVGRAAGDDVGSYAYNTGTLAVDSSTGSTRVYEIHLVTSDSFQITPAPIANVDGITANNKVYDTTTAAALNTGAATFNGIIGGDVLTVATATGNFTDKNAATGKTVNITGITLGGADAGNYTLVDNTATATADITAATITTVDGITASNKVYDTTTTASLNTGAATFNGILGSDVLTVGAAAGNFTDKNAATGKTVNITGITLGGADAGNYTLADNTATATADITPANLTISGLTANNKTYDTTDAATLSGAPALSGVLGGDAVTVSGTANTGTFDAGKNVGTGLAVTANLGGLSLSDTDAGNYQITGVTAPLTADITAATITTVDGITASNKVYDSTTAASLNTGAASFNGILGSDVLTVGAATGNFTDKNVGTGKTVNITGITLGGADAGNYTLADNTATATADITAATITTVDGITANNKVYDTTTAATLNSGAASFNGIQGSDVLTVATATGNFTDKNAATGKTVNITGITLGGADAGNYILADNTATATADITAATITTVDGITASNKVYDTTTTASLNTGAASFNGILGSDVLTVGAATGNFTDKNAATGKTVNITGITLGGADAGNYILADNTAATTADITPLAVVLNAPSVTKVYDGNVSYTPSSSNLTTIGGPLLGGDSVTGATIVYADKNVGTNKTVNFTAVSISDGNGGSNYNVTLNGNSTSTITRLNSVTWTGGGDGVNWSDAANWGGAIPDLANVANVNLGGANVTFTSSVGAIQIDNVSGGRLTFSSGTMDVANNATLTGYTQAAGTMDISGNLAITSTTAVTQTGGALIVGGTSSINSGANAISLTGSNDFVGTVTLDNTSGAAQITDANAITIGSSTLAGSLTVNSGGLITVASVTTGGTQQYNNNVRLGGAYTTNGGAFNVTGATAVASSSSISTGAGNVSLAGAVNGPGALTINSGGTTTFGSSIGQTTALASVTTDAAGTTNLGGNVRTSGAISFQDATSAATRTLQSTGNSSIRINAADSPAIISTSGSVTLGGTAHGSSGTPLSFTKTPSSLTLTQVSTSFFTGPTIPSTLTFQPGSSVTYNGVLIAASIAQQQAQQASSAAQGSAAAATVQEANETFGTDSVAEQVEYGFAGDVGTTPPMDHRLEETGISVPRCLEESREGLACK